MSPDEFALALRVLDAPLFLDNRGVATLLGVEFTATTSDGKSVFVTQLSPTLNRRVTDPDGFVRTLGRYGYQGAGITESGQLYFLELPPVGASLGMRLASSGPLPAAEVTIIARALIDALLIMASRGETHGMVTPAAVYLGSDTAVRLRWPGLVPALCSAGVDVATIATELGIVPFVAPETRSGAALETPADIFALGTTLYTALTGRPPFGGRTTATTMATVLADSAEPVTTVSGTLTSVLLRAIEADPADRWRDLEQFREALDPGNFSGPTGHAPALAGARGCAPSIALFSGIGLVLWIVSRYIP